MDEYICNQIRQEIPLFCIAMEQEYKKCHLKGKFNCVGRDGSFFNNKLENFGLDH